MRDIVNKLIKNLVPNQDLLVFSKWSFKWAIAYIIMAPLMDILFSTIVYQYKTYDKCKCVSEKTIRLSYSNLKCIYYQYSAI